MRKIRYILIDIVLLIFLVLAIVANRLNKGSYYLTGFITGIFSVALVYTIIAIINKYKGKEYHYDERQEMARGKCYKIAFFTMISLIGLDTFIREVFEINWGSFYLSCGCIVMISSTVYAVGAIMLDAYTYVNQNIKITKYALLAIGVLNIILAFLGEGLICDNKISNKALNFICGIAMIVIFVGYIIKGLLDKRELEQ